jgi:hypothetical protein
MSQAATRKDAAVRLLDAAGQGDMATVETLIADDFVLEQMVRDPAEESAPAGTSYDRASYLGFLGAVKTMTVSGMNLSFDRVIADGEHGSGLVLSQCLLLAPDLSRRAGGPYAGILRHRIGRPPHRGLIARHRARGAYIAGAGREKYETIRKIYGQTVIQYPMTRPVAR